MKDRKNDYLTFIEELKANPRIDPLIVMILDPRVSCEAKNNALLERFEPSLLKIEQDNNKKMLFRLFSKSAEVIASAFKGVTGFLFADDAMEEENTADEMIFYTSEEIEAFFNRLKSLKEDAVSAYLQQLQGQTAYDGQPYTNHTECALLKQADYFLREDNVREVYCIEIDFYHSRAFRNNYAPKNLVATFESERLAQIARVRPGEFAIYDILAIGSTPITVGRFRENYQQELTLMTQQLGLQIEVIKEHAIILTPESSDQIMQYGFHYCLSTLEQLVQNARIHAVPADEPPTVSFKQTF